MYIVLYTDFFALFYSSLYDLVTMHASNLYIMNAHYLPGHWLSDRASACFNSLSLWTVFLLKASSWVFAYIWTCSFFQMARLLSRGSKELLYLHIPILAKTWHFPASPLFAKVICVKCYLILICIFLIANESGATFHMFDGFLDFLFQLNFLFISFAYFSFVFAVL